MKRHFLGAWPACAVAAAAVLAFFLAFLGGCSDPSPVDPGTPVVTGPCGAPLPVFVPFPNGLAPVGTDTTLDLAAWNLEFFPLDLPGDYNCPHPRDTSRQDAAAGLINLLDLDVIAVEEISDTTGFRELIALCPGYAGILSPEIRGCNYQRVGFIYRTDQVTIHSWKLLFTNDAYAFPRSPLEVDFTISNRGRSYHLHLIVVHLKASGDSESIDRRRSATNQLKTYLDEQALQDETANYMIAGDWNDILNEPVSTSSFPAFLGAPDEYKFLDLSLAGNRDYSSLGSIMVDHLMVNQAACVDFSRGRVATLRLDQIVTGYGNVSDHRPVMVQAPMFK